MPIVEDVHCHLDQAVDRSRRRDLDRSNVVRRGSSEFDDHDAAL
jgi:hypothetical protein